MKNEPIHHRLNDLRFSNSSGKVIPLHHAFLTLKTQKMSYATAFILPFVFLGLIWWSLPLIIEGWTHLFQFFMQHIYQGYVGSRPIHLLGEQLRLPYPGLPASDPSTDTVYWNLGICVAGFALSFLLPARITPLTYLLRGALLIQAATSFAYLFYSKGSPYNIPIYITDSLAFSLYMLFMLPILLGFVYYIFDFGLFRKIFLTAGMIGYFLLAIPLQYMLHAIVIHEFGLLFLPLMYLLFGALLDVLMFVSIYALGMSWHSNSKGWEGRSA